MQRRLLSSLLLVTGLVLAQARAQEPSPSPGAAPKAAPGKAPESLKGYDPKGGEGKRIFVVPIGGTIDLGLASFVHRVVGEAKQGDVVLLDIKTFGGRVDAAVQIRDELLGAKATTVAFVDQRAISAGALISLAADTIIMTPGASIGAATPVQMGGDGEAQPTSEKVVSYMRAEMRATAEAKGRRADLAEAMVDPDVEVKGVIEKGKLLTLTTERALELGLADGRAADLDGAIALLNLQGAQREYRDTHWAERLARALTDPMVSSLLMTFGVLGLLMELYTPGFGIGGIIGITCLVLFFGGQYAANLAGWEEVILFLVGVALLLVEVLVIPGFGVAGIAGLLAIGASLVMAMFELHLPWDVSFELGYVQEMVEGALVRLALALVALIVGAIVFARFLPGMRLGKQLVLQSATSAASGYVGTAAEHATLLGKRGRVTTALRPAGIAQFDGHRVDVVSEGEFIDKDTEVEVIQVDGNRVVVRRVAVS